MIMTSIRYFFTAFIDVFNLFLEKFVLNNGMFQTTVISVLLALLVITPIIVWIVRGVTDK